MSQRDWEECIAAVEKIRALAIQEELFIEEEKFEQLWSLRERRRDLIGCVAKCCEGTTNGPELTGPQVARLSAVVHSIYEVDRRIFERLADRKKAATGQLERLYDGRHAVHGYRVTDGRIPLYIDRRG